MSFVKTFYKENGSTKKSKIAAWIAYAFLLLPFLIFAVGWFGKRYWIPILFILVYCFKKACQDADYFWIPQFNKENIVKIVFIIFIISVWVYYSGTGRFVFQNEDHDIRNAIYETLVYQNWPIINTNLIAEKWNQDVTATSLIYYIGFWLPAAVVGKIFGINAGYVFQMLWAVLGISLVYYFICARKEKLMVWPLVVIVFFSGLDIVGQYFTGENLSAMANDTHIEWWAAPYQFSSMTSQLFWVFNQAIPAWLCTILLLVQKNNKSVIFILACCMLPGTFPFVGLLILVLCMIFSREYGVFEKRKVGSKAYIKAFMKDTFTVQNVLGGGIVGIFSFLYLSANLSANKIMQRSVYGARFDNHLAKYLIFLLLEVGVFFIILYGYNKKNYLYYVILGSLILIPPIKVGVAGDFCMRVSIPALFLLMIFVIDALEKSVKDKNRVVLCSLIITLVVGSVTPIHEMTRTIKNTFERLDADTQVYETTAEEIVLLNGYNFSGAVNDSFFFKYIAR